MKFIKMKEAGILLIEYLTKNPIDLSQQKRSKKYYEISLDCRYLLKLYQIIDIIF